MPRIAPSCVRSSFFFFNDTATTEIYTLSLHDALPISSPCGPIDQHGDKDDNAGGEQLVRSEEHTSELQSQSNLVCRLLLEKKKQNRLLARPARHHSRSGDQDEVDVGRSTELVDIELAV